MINFNDLKQLIAFYHTGTLSETAEKLHISQSTITRNMQKIETDLGVPLFSRTKNSIALNEAGVLAAKQAELVMEQQKEMFHRVREFDRMNRTISIGSCAPIPVIDIYRNLSALFPNFTITSEVRSNAELLEGLEKDKYHLIILPCAVEKSDFICKKTGEEHLMFSLPKNHRFARRKSLSFEEMNGENVLLYHEIGFWQDIVNEKLSNSHFLVQNERYSLMELIENSLLPCFTSDITIQKSTPEKRVAVPITNPEANVTYYLLCKKRHQKRFFNLFS